MPHASAIRQTAREESPPAWRDGKRYAWLLGVLVPTLPFIVYSLVRLTGWGAFWFFGPVLILGVFPPLDLVIGLDAENPPHSVLRWLERDRDQHGPRARSQARPARTLAEQNRAGSERLRPLLRRTQPRSPRAGGDAGGPGQRAHGGELLGLPAADRDGQPDLSLGA